MTSRLAIGEAAEKGRGRSRGDRKSSRKAHSRAETGSDGARKDGTDGGHCDVRFGDEFDGCSMM